MKQLTANQKKAFTWWDSLSINEMKQLTEKYYPEFDHIMLYKMNPTRIESIYFLEKQEKEEKLVWEDYINSHGNRQGNNPFVRARVDAYWAGWRSWNGYEKE